MLLDVHCALYYAYDHYCTPTTQISMSQTRTRVNRSISANIVRVILPDGTLLGDVTKEAAIKTALEHSMDLIEIAPNANPPVCKIADYSKWNYERSKALKNNNTRSAVVKDIKFKVGIGPHDLVTKCKHIQNIIDKGGQVKVTVSMHGREVSHPEIATALLTQVLKAVETTARADGAVRKSLKHHMVTLVPL